MSDFVNDHGQRVGFPVPDFQSAPWPPAVTMTGRSCRVEPVDPDRHAADLFAAYDRAPNDADWTYLPYERAKSEAAYRAWMEETCLGRDPMFHAIIDLATEKAVGVASLMRIDPENAAIEVGYIHFSPLMQRGLLSTECLYLMMARVFDDLGYRRYEWKCNALNEPSRAAARRLGFNYEGTFRQMSVTKGRNRDTAWFSILDREWPGVKVAFETWLDPSNFDADGQQKQRLSDLTAEALPDRS